MKNSPHAQLSQHEIQPLLNLINSGQLIQAEILASKLLQSHPNTFILHNIQGIARNGLGNTSAAIESYRQALRLQPNMPDLHFNLGIALSSVGDLTAAVASYQKAIHLQTNFFEAYGNLGIVLQRQGKLEEAITCYQKGLTINPQDARGHFNLGTALRDEGKLDAAIKSYKHAIALFPNYADAHCNLGETLRDQGNMPDAIKSYQDTLTIDSEHSKANYNMAEFLYLAKRYDEAIPFFERSQWDDWLPRSMYCLYKAERFDDFKAKLNAIEKTTKHTAPFMQTLSTHYAINFGVEDTYNFCKNGFDFVYQRPIPELAAPNSPLLKQLLDDIHNTDIATRAQGMLYHGKQSAGNLFKRPEASFRALGELVKREFVYYKNHFASADCELILSFPDALEFTSSWYVKMSKGGYVDKHIHEIGWISGAVYLALPTKENPTDGCFEYGIHGDNYPILPTKSQIDFPVGIATPSAGDIVLFPSSLFHRTIPFNADEERICIAFDLKPAS